MANPLDVPLLAEYGTYHRDKRNLICHELGIPLIVFAIIIAERLVRIGVIDLAIVTIVAISFYYIRLAGRGAILAIVSLIGLYSIATFVTWPYAIAAFVIGWTLQFIGHAYEGKKPAFLTNLQHLLVGPLWLTVLLNTPRSAAKR